MTKANAFSKIFENREPVVEPEMVEEFSPSPLGAGGVKPEIKKERGRPATGKRSDDTWISRNFYVQRQTDLNVEDELLQLKRQGIKVDKSELVDLLMASWVKWRQGENIDLLLAENTPRRKG